MLQITLEASLTDDGEGLPTKSEATNQTVIPHTASCAPNPGSQLDGEQYHDYYFLLKAATAAEGENLILSCWLLLVITECNYAVLARARVRACLSAFRKSKKFKNRGAQGEKT